MILSSLLRDDLFLDRHRYRCVMRKLHRVGSAALRLAAHVRRIPEHHRERNLGAQHACVRALAHVEDATASRVEVARHWTHEVLGDHDLDAHHRLDQGDLSLLCTFLEGHRGGDLEGGAGRVDLVVAPEVEANLDVHHRVAGEHAAAHRVFDPLLDRGDELLRDDAADHLVHEDEAGAALGGLHVDAHVAVLAVAARLADEATVDVDDLLLDRLAVGDLRLADVGVDLELALEAVDDDLEVELAHPGDDRLPRLRVGVGAERRILVGELLEGAAELVEISLGLGLDRDGDDRLRQLHLLEDDLALVVAERVARARVAHADGGVDVPRVADVDLFTLVGVHAEDAAEALALAARGVHHRLAALGRAGVDAEEGEIAEGIVHHLEREGREGLLVARLADDDLVLLVG